jgi:hemoglobin
MNHTAAKYSEISEASICELVDTFYGRIRVDPLLGPIFARAIPGEWQPHLKTMYAFWSSVMLSSGRYKGNPVAKHQLIEGIRPELFERWLLLFHQTCDELFDEKISPSFRSKAETIADSLKFMLFQWKNDRPGLQLKSHS